MRRACGGVPDCGVADSMIISGGDAIIGVTPRIRDFARRTPSSATMRAYPIGSDADSPRSTHQSTGAAESPGCPNDPPIALASAPSNPAAARLKRCALPQMPPAAASIIPSAAALTAVYPARTEVPAGRLILGPGRSCPARHVVARLRPDPVRARLPAAATAARAEADPPPAGRRPASPVPAPCPHPRTDAPHSPPHRPPDADPPRSPPSPPATTRPHPTPDTPIRTAHPAAPPPPAQPHEPTDPQPRDPPCQPHYPRPSADGRGPDRSVEGRFPWDRALYSSSGPASRPGGSMRASS